MGKKIIKVKLIERDGEDKVLGEYEIGSWDMLTEIFNECLAGIVKTIKEFSSSSKEIDLINIGENLILLDYGETILTALLVKKDLQHAKYVIHEITSKFELFFWEYLENYNNYMTSYSKEELFRPIEMVIRNLIKL